MVISSPKENAVMKSQRGCYSLLCNAVLRLSLRHQVGVTQKADCGDVFWFGVVFHLELKHTEQRVFIIIESFRLENTFKIMKSRRKPNPTKSTIKCLHWTFTQTDTMLSHIKEGGKHFVKDLAHQLLRKGCRSTSL